MMNNMMCNLGNVNVQGSDIKIRGEDEEGYMIEKVGRMSRTVVGQPCR